MKSLSHNIQDVVKLIEKEGIRSISFDIDGTLYPMKKVHERWWKCFFIAPIESLKFLKIRKEWEKKRQGKKEIIVRESDIRFFEDYLLKLLHQKLIPQDIKELLKVIRTKNIALYFLSDHGTETKLKALGISHLGQSINCLSETGELKPHAKIATLFQERYHINPKEHLHLGDRWTDEEQAKLLKSHFQYLAP